MYTLAPCVDAGSGGRFVGLGGCVWYGAGCVLCFLLMFLRCDMGWLVRDGGFVVVAGVALSWLEMA